LAAHDRISDFTLIAMTAPVLELRNITKSYDANAVLKGV
jgi:hypothetical protein